MVRYGVPAISWFTVIRVGEDTFALIPYGVNYFVYPTLEPNKPDDYGDK